MKRHKWGDPIREEFLTVRICAVCGLHKVTHHEGDGFPWVTYHGDGTAGAMLGEALSPMPQCD